MKKILLAIIFIIYTVGVFAQNTFQTHIQDNNNKKAYRVASIDNSYIILGSTKSPLVLTSASITIIDSVGSIKEAIEISDTLYDLILLDFHNTDSTYIFLGLKNKKNVYSDCYLWVMITDYNLNVVSNNYYFIDSTTTNGILYSTVNHKENIVISSFYGKYNYVDFRSFIYEISPNGDSVNCNINNFPDTNAMFCNIMYISSNLYKISASSFYIQAANQIVYIDSNLNYVDYKVVNILYNDPFSFGIVNKPNEYYILYNIGSDDKDINITHFNATNDSVLNYITIGSVDTVDISAYNGLVECDGGFYVGYTSDYEPSNGWYGDGQESKFVLTKLDSNLNIIWDKEYSLSGYYIVLVDMITTTDNGCLLVGASQNNNSSIEKNDILLIKVDSNGIAIWTKNIKISTAKISIFPNPTTDYINIEVKGSQQIKELSIIDINGKQVLKKQINATQNQLDVITLSSGLYIIEGVMKNGRRFSEKFVKE